VGDRSALRLHGWRSSAVLSIALVMAAAGFGQFGATAALGDVATSFGETRGDATLAEQAGLSGTVLGVGLAVIRLASLGALPLAGMADRVGRRATLLCFCAVGLFLTAAAALSPTYWWFVVAFAVGRPFFTATDTVGEVTAAEQTASVDRAKALALVAASYGVGSGLVAIVLGAVPALGFRGVFALALLPLALVVVVGRRVSETDRYRVTRTRRDKPLPVLGAVQGRFRSRLAVLAMIGFAVSVITGPANSFLFVYAENVLGLPGSATAGMLIGAGAAGLVGLFAGRWAADRLGRRPTAAFALVAIAAGGMLTYSGSVPAVVVGYIVAVGIGSTFAPAFASLHNELFPTEVRAAAAGWMVAAGVLGAAVGLLAFGSVADVGERFSLAAVAVFGPAALASALFALLPETAGRELEEWDRR
jgi:MFS family permease